MIGEAIEIYWPDDGDDEGGWYEASVKAYQASTNLHMLYYPKEGQTETVDFRPNAAEPAIWQPYTASEAEPCILG